MPADLSPTDQRILALLAQGLHDAEIAVRVGLPVGDVKARVLALMQRQRLLDRAALVEWYSADSSTEPAELAANQDAGSRRALLVLGGVLVVAAALVAALLLLTDGDGASSAANDRTPGGEVSPSPTMVVPTATIEPPPPLSLDTIRAAQLGTGEALLVARRGEFFATEAIDRLYLDPVDGTLVVEPVWRVPEDWVGENPGFVQTIVPNAHGTRLAIGSAPTLVDGEVRALLVVGTVGEEFPRGAAMTPGYYPAFFAGRKVAIAPTADDLRPAWQLFDPATAEFTPMDVPPGATAGPIGWTERTGIIWPASQGDFIDASGQVVMHIEHEGTYPQGIESYAVAENDQFDGTIILPGGSKEADEGVAIVSWWPRFDTRYVSEVWLGNGQVLETWTGTMTVAGLAGRGAWTGTYCQRSGLCVIAKLSAGTVIPFSELGPEGAPFQSLVGSRRGPFAKVKADVQGCVPELAEPGAAADGRCLFAGNLVSLGELDITTLVPRANIVEVDGVEYVAVYDLDGHLAWMEAGLVDFRREFEEMTLR